MEIHIIYTGHSYLFGPDDPSTLNLFIFYMVKKYQLKSCLFTLISMFKSHLVPKNVMEDYYKGSLKDENLSLTIENYRESVHDNLDTFFEQIKLGNNVESVLPTLGMCWFPKLTEDELVLVENKNEDYSRTFADFLGIYQNIDEHKTKNSESESKFAFCMCFRISTRVKFDEEPEFYRFYY